MHFRNPDPNQEQFRMALNAGLILALFIYGLPTLNAIIHLITGAQ
jgi:hypothetical protein